MTTESNKVDIHVGNQLRRRRKELAVSQERLAQSIGLTFQQIQKYERGANRISASRLFALCSVLRTEVSYFFEGLPYPTLQTDDLTDKPAPVCEPAGPDPDRPIRKTV